MKKYHVIKLWVGAGLIGILALGGCAKKDEAQAQPAAGGFAVNVVAFKVEEKDLSQKISMVGSLGADEFVEIKSEISGAIREINFEEGQPVQKGDVLFRIDQRKLQAAYDEALANLKLAKATADRYETLVKTQAVSRQEYDQTVAGLEVNRAAVALSKEQLEDATIIAPFAGVMGKRLVSPGQVISSGTVLTYLVSQDPMKAEFHVPERYLGEISVGQKIELKVAAYRDEIFKGEVYFIDPQIDETTRTALIKAKVPNPQGKLRQGMFANLELIVSVNPKAIVVPETSLIVKGDEVFVYVIKEDNTVDWRKVDIGRRMEGVAEVVSGLSAGEVVVTEGYQKIGPGSTVNPEFESLEKKKPYEII